MKILRLLLVSICILFVSGSWGQKNDPITVTYEPVWVGIGTDLKNLPVRLTVTNSGNPTVVQIKWMVNDIEMITMFDMPKGSEKQREIYFSNRMTFEPPEIIVKRGLIDVPQTIEFGSNLDYSAIKIGIISDNVGLISALKEDKKGQFKDKPWTSGFSIGVAQPGKAPTRSVGYDGLNLLVLSEGAERLSNEEVSAIKNAVNSGLRLVFCGGTIQPILNDPRWIEFLPVKVQNQVEVVKPPRDFKQFSHELPTETPMVRSLAKNFTAQAVANGFVIVADHSVGAGSVTFLAFDPFGSGWKDWSGRYAFFYSLTRPTRTGNWVNYLSERGGNEQDYGYGVMGTTPGDNPTADVFGVKIPSSGRVMLVLLGYFIFVVPVNFLVLKKLKRGELAWFTAPLIALGAAGVLFAFAGQLYSAQASRFSSGWLVGSNLSDQAVFFGKQQLFFPGTGKHDLRLEGVEIIKSTTYSDYSMLGTKQISGRFFDVDSVKAPNYEVNNLSFREFGLQQIVKTNNQIATLNFQSEKSLLKGNITNPFDEPITDAKVMIGPTTITLGIINPGESKEFEGKVSGKNEQCWFEGQMSGAEFGSKFGESVGNRSVQILYSLHLEDGK